MHTNSTQWTKFFNWTMTYREDSTFFHPYASITSLTNNDDDDKQQQHPPVGPELDEYIRKFGLANRDKMSKGKTKKVAWFVSNCNSVSGREAFTKELQKYIEVIKAVGKWRF